MYLLGNHRVERKRLVFIPRMLFDILLVKGGTDNTALARPHTNSEITQCHKILICLTWYAGVNKCLYKRLIRIKITKVRPKCAPMIS